LDNSAREFYKVVKKIKKIWRVPHNRCFIADFIEDIHIGNWDSNT
jgi:hypothetical protein